MRPLSFRASAVALALSFVVLACADAQGEADAGGFPDPARRRASAFTVEEAASAGGDTLFTSITGIDADSRGQVYVGDWFAARVAVFDSTGTLVRTVGRKGLGPGEFRSIRGVQVLPGDSLLVHDPSAARVSVFPPGAGRPAYVVNLAAAFGGPAPFLLRRTPANDAFIGLWRPSFRPDDTGPRTDEVRILAPDGSPRGEPVLRLPSKSFVRVEQGGGFSVMPNPFGREAFVAAGDGVVHHAWSDSAAVVSVDAEGRRTGGFRIAHPAPPVTDADVDSAVAALPPMMADAFRDALRDSVPARWPAVRGLLADDEGMLWMALAAPAGEGVEWARFTPDGRYLGSAFLPSGTGLHAVRGGRMYAVRSDDTGVPRVVVYRWTPQPARGGG